MKKKVSVILVAFLFLTNANTLFSQLRVENDGSLNVNSFSGNYEKANWTKVHYQYSMAYNLWNSYYAGDVFNVRGDGMVWARYGYLTESDIANKANIQLIESPLDKINKLNGVAFNRSYIQKIIKVDSSESRISVESGRYREELFEPTEYGLIAQEVEKVIPEAVYALQDSSKAIKYSSLIPVLIEAIKEQQAQIETLQAIVNKHDAEMTQFKKSRKWKRSKK